MYRENVLNQYRDNIELQWKESNIIWPNTSSHRSEITPKASDAVPLVTISQPTNDTDAMKVESKKVRAGSSRHFENTEPNPADVTIDSHTDIEEHVTSACANSNSTDIEMVGEENSLCKTILSQKQIEDGVRSFETTIYDTAVEQPEGYHTIESSSEFLSLKTMSPTQSITSARKKE